MPTTPADVIAASLRRAGVRDPDVLARTVAADLAGHSLLADSPTPRRTKTAGPKPRCQRPVDPHYMTDLVGGRCPVCGWSTDDNPTTTTGA